MAKKSTLKRTDEEFGQDTVNLPDYTIAPDGTKLSNTPNTEPGKLRIDATTGPVASASVGVTSKNQAKNKEQVDEQDARTRLWQSLSTTYAKRTEDSNKQYDLNKNAADRAANQRGMGRSSYNLQTMANIDTEKANAADRIQQELIADYQNRLSDIENSEFQREQFQYQKDSDKQQIAIAYINNMLQNGGTPSDDLLKQAGLSRKDYDQMKKKQSTYVYPKKKTTTDDKKGSGLDDSSFEKGLDDNPGTGNDGKPVGFATIKSILYKNGKYYDDKGNRVDKDGNPI